MNAETFITRSFNIFVIITKYYYKGADKSLARPGRKQANVSVKMAWLSFGALPCMKKKNFMTARVSMLLKSRASPTCFRTCFLPGRVYQHPGNAIQPRTMRTARSLAPTVEKRKEQSNIPSCYIKRGKFYDDLRNAQLLKKYFATRGQFYRA